MKSLAVLFPPPSGDRSPSALVASHTEGLGLIADMLGTAVRQVHPEVESLPVVRSAYGTYIKAAFAEMMDLPGRRQELQRLGLSIVLEGPAKTWLMMRIDGADPLIRGVLRPKELGPVGARGTMGSALPYEVRGDQFMWLMWDPAPSGTGLASLSLVETANPRSDWFPHGIAVVEEAAIPVPPVAARYDVADGSRSVAGMIARRPAEDDQRALEPSADEESEQKDGSCDEGAARRDA